MATRPTRGTAHAMPWARQEHTRSTGKGLTYTIEADRHGSYRILLGDKVLRAVHAPVHGFGIRAYGSKRQQESAFVLARADIEQLRGMTED